MRTPLVIKHLGLQQAVWQLRRVENISTCLLEAMSGHDEALNIRTAFAELKALEEHLINAENPRYMAIIVVRQNIKGARREEHEYHADDTADLWGHAIEFLKEGFSVISVDLWTVE